MKVVIVGGVAGGASAAARLRRLDENAQIVILERTGYVSYANCGLPYYIGGVIKEQRSLTLQTPASFAARFNVDARVRQEVIAIDRTNKQVMVRDLESDREYQEEYDKLILAPGAKPLRLNLPGIDSPRIYTLRTVEDTLRLREAALAEGVRRAAIIGGGFVGVELAENLRELGLDVCLIQREEHILTPLDGDMASFLHCHMRENGVELLLNKTVAGFAERDNGLDVLLADGQKVGVDMVALAAGSMPESDLAAKAGLELGPRGSIAVDEHMRTSDADIYAVGDAVAVNNLVTGQKTVVALAGPANKQGRIAADNIAGLDSCYIGSPATAVLKIFAMTAAFCGLNEQAAQAAGIDYEKIILAPASHAAYYPGGNLLTVKLLFAKATEKIIGAQIVGFDGVDKRLDVISTAMQDGSVTLLDVRTAAEYAQGRAEGFNLNIPVDELRPRLGELDKSKPVYVMCRTGLRSYIACRMLSQAGLECYNFAGGYFYYASVHGDFLTEHAPTECGRPL